MKINKWMLGCLLLVAGCASAPTVYTSDFTTLKQPQISLPEALANVKHGIETDYYGNQNIQVSKEGFSYEYGGNKYSTRFDEIQNMEVFYNSSGDYCADGKGDLGNVCWKSQNDAQRFVDAVQAMHYYTSKQYLTDQSTAFADFQEKVKVWQALPQKPPLPEEARRFRVLADDAVQNKDFDKAADYYEQGLAIDPMWPAGQFNAAIIYGELKYYSRAAMHMKCYLALKPDAQDAKAYQDKIYIWEEKANE